VFGEAITRKIFSKTWQFREEGLAEVENMINLGRIQDEARAFVNSIGAIRYTIGDKMAQVAQKSMNFLITVCNMMNPNISN